MPASCCAALRPYGLIIDNSANYHSEAQFETRADHKPQLLKTNFNRLF